MSRQRRSPTDARLAQVAATVGVEPLCLQDALLAYGLAAVDAKRRPTQLLESAAVAAYLRPRLADLPFEQLWLLLLDVKNRVQGEHLVAQGSLNGMSVTTREIMRPAVVEAAAGIILVHNHPSGDPTPSEADRVLTDRVRAAGDLFGIHLLDHVIVAGLDHVSLMGR